MQNTNHGQKRSMHTNTYIRTAPHVMLKMYKIYMYKQIQFGFDKGDFEISDWHNWCSLAGLIRCNDEWIASN